VFGRALDVFIRNPDGSLQLIADSRYDDLGQMAQELGFVWGGRWGDPGHFEYHPGMRIVDMCPDPSDCEMAVARHGSQGNYYVPANISEQTATDAAEGASSSTIKEVLVSAIVGAIAFQIVAYAAKKVVR
jgi:hypothetical protein